MGLEMAPTLGCCLVLMFFCRRRHEPVVGRFDRLFVLVAKALFYGDVISRSSAVPLVLAGAMVLIS
jgi:hypothetical protein